MPTIHGILSFPTLFVPKVAKGATDPKYNVSILLPPGDPQIATIQAEVDAASKNTFPSGFPAKGDLCFMPYDTKYAGKDYYDPRFSGYYVLSCSAKEDDRPSIVDTAFNKIVDPGAVYGGMMGHVHLGISGYVKGTGGVGGWLNGVMITGEVCEQGRLDNKPSVEQMFASVPGAAATTKTPAQAAPQQHVTQAPPGNTTQPPPTVHQMTDKANGDTYEALIANGWTDELLIQHGLMLPPGGIQPSFAG